jgi:hypothetical protein
MQGNIMTLVASPPDSPVASLESGPGQRVTEIDAPEVDVDRGTERVNEALAHFAANYRVDVDAPEGRLIRKPESRG